MTNRNAGVLAAAIFVVGTLASVAHATRPCGARVCAEEIAAACAGETGRAFRTCKRHVVRNCRRTTCTCDGTGTACGSPSGAFLD
jgi:hypothetical protein